MHHPAPVETTELYSWPQTDGKDGRAKGSGDDDDDAPLVVLSVVPLMRGAAVGSIEVVDRYWIDIGLILGERAPRSYCVGNDKEDSTNCS
jgi:hypothetical protein